GRFGALRRGLGRSVRILRVLRECDAGHGRESDRRDGCKEPALHGLILPQAKAPAGQAPALRGAILAGTEALSILTITFVNVLNRHDIAFSDDVPAENLRFLLKCCSPLGEGGVKDAIIRAMSAFPGDAVRPAAAGPGATSPTCPGSSARCAKAKEWKGRLASGAAGRCRSRDSNP